jgi:hypothetical protein
VLFAKGSIIHRSTVVESPGGCPWGFGKLFLGFDFVGEDPLLSFLLHYYCQVFQNIPYVFSKGYKTYLQCVKPT